MKKNTLKKLVSLALAAVMALSLFACGKKTDTDKTDGKTYKIGICNYVDDASLNQIVANIRSQLEAIGQEKGVTFDISYDNCNADAAVMNQIIANFIADKVDLMIGVATPVAVAMQSRHRGQQDPRGLRCRVRSRGRRSGGEHGRPRRQHHRHLRLSGHRRHPGPDLHRRPRRQDHRPAV